MMIKFVGKTRTSFIKNESVVHIEQILRDLAEDFLGPKLYDSSGVAEDIPLDQRVEIDLQSHGWLLRTLQQELTIRRESHRKWLKVVSKEQLAIMEEQGLSPTCHIDSAMLFFVTHDYDTSEDLGPGKEVFLDGSEQALGTRSFGKGKTEEVFQNSLRINWFDADVIGDELAQTCLSVISRIFDNDIFDHGFCCLSDQYDETNLSRSDGGVRAVGLDASKCLPGFYWANYFGSYLCDLIGRDVLMTAPGCRCIQLTSGILVANELPPDRWSDLTFIENECSAMNHIGRHLFFEKGKPATGTLFAST